MSDGYHSLYRSEILVYNVSKSGKECKGKVLCGINYRREDM
jgi:hypothetical protein